MTDHITIPDELMMPPPSRSPVPTELESLRIQNRVLWITILILIAGVNAVPVVLIFDPVPSLLKNVAAVTTSGNPDWIGWGCVAALLLSLPQLISQTFAPQCWWRVPALIAAAAGYAIGGVSWIVMALLSKGMDYGFYDWVLAFDGAMNLVVFFTICFARNHEILRALHWGER